MIFFQLKIIFDYFLSTFKPLNLHITSNNLFSYQSLQTHSFAIFFNHERTATPSPKSIPSRNYYPQISAKYTSVPKYKFELTFNLFRTKHRTNTQPGDIRNPRRRERNPNKFIPTIVQPRINYYI